MSREDKKTSQGSGATTLATVVRVIGQVLDKRGLEGDAIITRAGIDSSVLDRPGERVSRAAMKRLWPLAVEATGDPAFGLLMAEHFNPATSHTLGLAWLASATLREALTRLARYQAIITAGVPFTLTETERALQMEIGRRGDVNDLADEAIDAYFAITVRLSRMVARADLRALSVSLVRADPGRHAAYKEALGIIPTFSAELNLITFRLEDVDAPLVGADPLVATQLDRMSEQYLAEVLTQQVSASVRDILEHLLPTGRPTVEQVARIMNRSAKKLQRALLAEGARFSDLLEQTRTALALRYVRDPQLRLSEVAQILGFSDQSSFNRAFRRWSGYAPGELRRQGVS